MKILVTGAAGFIGAHLSKQLLKEKNIVVGADNLNSFYSPQFKAKRLEKLIGKHKNFFFYKEDILNKDFLDQIFTKFNFDWVIHLAAQAGVRYSLRNPYICQKNNLEGTLNILEMLRKSPETRLIFASSSSVYGATSNLPFIETDPCDQPLSLYGATKRAGELIAKTYNHLFGIRTVCARFFTVFGPWGRPDMAYFKFTKSLFAGRSLNIYEEDTRRDFTYIDDIVSAVSIILKKDFNFEIINLGNSKPVNLGYFIKCLEKETDKKAKKVLMNLPSGDMKATYANIAKARKLLNWIPKVKIEEGLKYFVSWFRREHLR